MLRYPDLQILNQRTVFILKLTLNCLLLLASVVFGTLAEAGVTPLEQHFGPTKAPALGCSHCQAETTDIYIEVVPGLSQLEVDIFDPEAVSGGTDFDATTAATAFEILDPNGVKFSGFSCSTGGVCTCDAGFSCGTLTGSDNAWVNFVAVANPQAGHWRVSADVSARGENGYRVRAHDGDPTAGGEEVNVYLQSAFTPGNSNADSGTKVDTYYPYIAGGCFFLQNNFDYDSESGPAAGQSIVTQSRTGAFSQTTLNADLSGQGVWKANSISGFTSDSSADEYGIWSLTTSINGLTQNNRTDNYIGRYDSADPTGLVTIAGGLQNEPLTFRVYAPSDADAAPEKPYLSQRITSTNVPLLNSVTRHIIEVSFTNPTPYAIGFDVADSVVVADNDNGGASAANVITATVPASPVVTYAADTASASAGSLISVPAGAAGDIVWDPGTVPSGETVTLTYAIDIAPTAVAPIPVTGSPDDDTGTDAEFLDETQDRDVYFGALCDLALSPVSGTASIGDTLFEDSNGSGVFDMGEGLAGVTMTLQGTAGAGNGVTLSTTTDAQGGYSFDGLPAGTYRVTVDETTLPAELQGNNTVDPNGGGDSTASLTVADGETNNEQDFGYRPTTVSGHVYSDTNGNGMQDAGEPDLAMVDVLITDALGGMQTVTTDANGDWIATVPPGSTTADVDEGSLPSAVVQTEGTDVTTVTAVAGSNTDAGIDGYFTPATVSGHIYTDSNGNGVQDAGEPDQMGADVLITDSNGATQTVSTDANGNWVAKVPPGATMADVQEGTLLEPTAMQTEGTDPTAVTAVAGADSDAGNDGYFVSATVSGHIYTDSNGNGVQDAGEPEQAGVDVLITDVDGATQTVSTDANGDWSATVPPGATTADVQEGTLDEPTATQTEGTDPTVVTAIANADADAGNDGYFVSATISGHIYTDTNGNGTQDAGEPNQAGVDVLVTDADGATQTVSTDANGDWTATVPPGAVTADVQESTLADPMATQTEGTDPTAVTAVAGTDTDAGIDGYQPSESTVSGVIYEDSDGDGMQDPGEPGISGVAVTVTDSEGDIQALTSDGSGSYSAVVPPGSTTITIDELTVPGALNQTEGSNPTTVNVPVMSSAVDVDGFELVANAGLPPVAEDESTETPPDTPVTLSLRTGGVSDPDNNADLSTVDLDPSTAGVQATLTTPEGIWESNGAGEVTFTPTPGFSGEATVSYVVADTDGNLSNVAILSVVIASGAVAIPLMPWPILLLMVILMVNFARVRLTAKS